MTESTPRYRPHNPTVALDDEISLWIPTGFHSLGLEVPEEERQAHLEDVAAEIWPSGTDFQRETVTGWYSEIADSAAEDGALYAGLCLVATEDEEPGSAFLLIRAERADCSDAMLATTGLVEAFSADPAKEVYRATAAGRPIAVVFSTLTWTPSATAAAADQPATPLTIATAEAYIPLPQISRILVLCISSPTLELFPDFVSLLSGIAETVEVGGTPTTEAVAAGGVTSTANSVRAVFG